MSSQQTRTVRQPATMNAAETDRCDLGVIGLGVMGRNLLQNMADHGIPVAGYDLDEVKVGTLRAGAATTPIIAAKTLSGLVAALRRPRALMMLVPAGAAVDTVIQELLPHLDTDDVLIDGGNSHFRDTDVRAAMLDEYDIHYLGVGVSGGEHGARHGASIMPGGPQDAYERVRHVLEAVAAKVDGESCVTWLGPGSAGHYVKMIHNGIEYGLMQLIAETYDLLRRGLGLSDDELHEIYATWNHGELESYLLGITADIFTRKDERTGRKLIDVVLDEAAQKGTGRWATQDAMTLETPTPIIDAAVTARNISLLKDEREAAARRYNRPVSSLRVNRESFVGELRAALHTAMILTFAQGMAQLSHASAKYGYELRLDEVARIWRGGCIIRSALLEPIRAAYRDRPDLPNLLDDDRLGVTVMAGQEPLRHIVAAAASTGVPTPALMSGLAYFDAYRCAELPANLIQAQRDYFGAHTYERVDARGHFHTHWAAS